MSNPAGIAVDAFGNLYIGDIGNQVVRMVSNGVIITIAGTGTAGFSGDGGLATAAQINDPFDLAVHPLRKRLHRRRAQ